MKLKFKITHTLLVAFFLLIGDFHFAQAQESVVHFYGKDLLIGEQLHIAEDQSGKLDKNQALKQLTFIPSNSTAPNMGSSTSNWWVKFSIENHTAQPSVLLELAYPMITALSIYEGENGERKLQTILKTDTFFYRKIKNQNLVFDLNIPQGTKKTYYVQVGKNTQVVLPLILRSEASFLQSTLTSQVLTGIYIGALLVMILYNLFVYFSIKERNYIYYVLYILFIGLTQTTITGYSFWYLWPEYPGFNAFAATLFSALSGLMAVLFFRSFLNTAIHTPRWDKALFAIIILYAVSVVCYIIGFESYSYYLTNIAGIASVIIAIITSSILTYKKVPSAKFFLLAWFIFFIGLVLFVLRNINVLPFNNFTNYTMQAGTAIEVILLSFALADKINILKKDTEISQEKALKISLENEKIIREQNIVLERNVDARTIELRETNEDLSLALTQLKDAQTLLIESEKMASLGQLTAGIAHEINNPINFVSSNIKPLRRDIADLMEILQGYEETSQLHSLEEIKAKLLQIEDLKSELDLEYIKTELDMLLKGMEEGAQRTVAIVKGLKIFSRVDDSDLNNIDINEGLESTLVILNYQLGGQVKVIKEMSNIPSVEGYGGKLNQVFMNILSNAIYALKTPKNTNPSPTLWVKTTLKDAHSIQISLRDNGIGISPEVKEKIFDPFFTTKEVGEGTGLGLSIVFKIIEAHYGQIEVNTEIGNGTEFVITLPIKKKGFVNV